MKKTKILAVLGVCIAMGITACNNTSSEEPKSEAPSSEQAPAHVHSWDAGTVTTAATCTTKGVKTFHCSGCEETKTEEIAALGHDWDAGTVTKEPTCTEKGVKTFHCSRCTETKTEDIKEAGHVWDAGTVTTEPTCSQKGVKTFNCTKCTATKTEDINALGHDWGEWTVEREADCHEAGLKKRTCQREGCNAEETDMIAKTSHEWGEWEVTKPASCVAGERQRVCSICGDIEKEVLPLDPDVPHNWTEWTEVKAATCGKGQEKRECQNCHIAEFREIPAIEGAEHSWGKPTVVPDEFADDGVTLVKAGYTMKTCVNCGGTRLEIEAAKATLDKYMDNGTEKLSEFKNETAKDADDDTKTIQVGKKLKSNNMSFSFKFDFDKAADVVVYQDGCMDSYSGNKDRTYYSKQYGDSLDYSKANFDFSVNGKSIDLYGQRFVKWSDVVEERDQDDTTDPLRKSGYSTFGEFLIGEAELQEGENTFVYKRLESYNLILRTIILEVTYPDHVHEAAENAEWFNTNPDFHWKNCKENDGHKLEKARHEFGDPILDTLETCSTKGQAHRVCKVCGYTENIERGQLAHDYSIKLADNAAGEGYIASETLACANNCGETAIKWAATAFDATKSAAASDADKGPQLKDSDKAVDFIDSVCQNKDKNYETKGTHIVYNVNVPANAENVGLAMLVTKNQWTDEPFDMQSNDGTKGYIKNDKGEDVRPDSRYGLKVDGVEYYLGKNGGAQKASSSQKWMFFPGISLNLEAGVHEIDIFKYGGYQVNHYAFMLVGLPAVEGSSYTLGDWVTTDNSIHYKTSEDLADVKFCSGAHEWVADESKQDVEPTCTTDGVHYKKCMICGKEAEDKINKLGHDYGEMIVDTEPTCTEKGVGHKICARCQNVDDELDVEALGHDWGDVVADTPATCTAEGVGHKECKRCHTVENDIAIPKVAHQYTSETVKNSAGKDVIVSECGLCHAKQKAIKFLDYTSKSDNAFDGAEADGKLAKSNAKIKWNIPVEAGTVKIQLNMKIASSNNVGQTWKPDKYSFNVSIDGGEVTTLQLDSQTRMKYSEFGISTTGAYFDLVTYEIPAAGDLELEFVHNNADYRLNFTEEVRLVYVA